MRDDFTKHSLPSIITNANWIPSLVMRSGCPSSKDENVDTVPLKKSLIPGSVTQNNQ